MLKNRSNQVIALLLTFVLVLGGTAFDPTTAVASSGKNIKAGDSYYTILPTKSRTAEYVKPAKKGCTSASIPNTVKISGKTYQVTGIGANAFKGCTKLKKVSIGKNVEKIGKKAFYGCGNLKNVIINTTKLTSKNVGADAVKGISAKAVVTVPKSKLAAYKKILKAKGLTGKQQKVKAKETTTGGSGDGGSQDKYLTFDEKHPLPEPENVGFTIGDRSSSNAVSIEKNKIMESSAYTNNGTIPFTVGICLKPAIYGKWITKPGNGFFVSCGYCGELFESEAMRALHISVSECDGVNYVFGELESYTAHSFIPDPAPCKVVYRFILPNGLSYKANSLRVVNFFTGEIGSQNYHTAISENEIVVTIADIKSEPFYVPFNLKEYEKNPRLYDDFMSEYESTRMPITVTFDTEMNDNVSVDNTVSASVTYSYKDAKKTIDLGDATIHTASLQITNTDASGNSLSGATFDLYQMKTKFREGSSTGVLNWEEVASGITAGTVIKGLGSGGRNGENRYRIVQTSVPAGYEEADYTEFELGIDCNGKTTVTAKKLKGGDISVNGGTVCVNITNVADSTTPIKETDFKDTGSSDTGSTDTGSGGTDSGTPPKTDTGNVVDQPNDTDDGFVRVKAVYYKDGVRSFSMTYQQDTYGGMMDSYNISDCSDEFQGCTLQKITVDGTVVDSLPAKIREDAEVCFYYTS